jgi:hypothetical protein
MSNLVDYAKRELDILNLGNDDRTGEGMDFHMRDHILRMVEMFSEEGHSGFSASYALSILKRVLEYKPLTPLTGNDDEWNEVGDGVFQNRRASNVFKENGQAYWMDGIVFWEWYSSPDIDDGKPYKAYFTSRDSRVNIESFPWTMPETPEYRERETNEI